MSKQEQGVTFGMEAAREAWHAGALLEFRVCDKWLSLCIRPRDNIPYRLAPSFTPTAAQVSAIVKAEAGKLAAGGGLGETLLWNGSCWTDVEGRAAATRNPDALPGWHWFPVLRPDLEQTTPEPDAKPVRGVVMRRVAEALRGFGPLGGMGFDGVQERASSPEPEPVHDGLGRDEARSALGAGIDIVDRDGDLLRAEDWTETLLEFYGEYPPYRLATQEPLDPDTARDIAGALEGWEMHHEIRQVYPRRVRGGVQEWFKGGSWRAAEAPITVMSNAKTWHLRRPGTAERMARERTDQDRGNLSGLPDVHIVGGTRASAPVCPGCEEGWERCECVAVEDGPAYDLLPEREGEGPTQDPPRRHAELTLEQLRALALVGCTVVNARGVSADNERQFNKYVVDDPPCRLLNRPLTEEEARRVGEALPGAILTDGRTRHRFCDGEWLAADRELENWNTDEWACPTHPVNDREWWLESVPEPQAQESVRGFSLADEARDLVVDAAKAACENPEFAERALRLFVDGAPQEPAEEPPLPRETSSLAEVVRHGESMPGKPCGRDADGHHVTVDVNARHRFASVDSASPSGCVRLPVTLLPADPPKPPVETRDGHATRAWCIANPGREAKEDGFGYYVRWSPESNDFRERIEDGGERDGAGRTYCGGMWRPADGKPWEAE